MRACQCKAPRERSAQKVGRVKGYDSGGAGESGIEIRSIKSIVTRTLQDKCTRVERSVPIRVDSINELESRGESEEKRTRT
jgi:hypothetical protein